MKKLLSIFMALVFSVIIGGAVSAATGLNPLAVIGGGSVLSAFIPKMEGVAPMAIQKEIWINSLVENLFADNQFMSKAFNADEFVNSGRTVHIPNAGSPSGVVKNRTSFPATIKSREDSDLEFNLNEFTTDPIRIPHADTVELSYNKRESVLMNDKANLQEEIANDFIYQWSPGSGQVIRTTGDAVTAHAPSATGNRKALTKADFKTAMTKFNKANIPQENRYALVDADMYDQLIDSLTEKQLDNFNKLADVSNGVVGKLYTFNIMMRSKAGRYTTALAPKLWSDSGATTDHGAAILWHVNSVCRALGQTEAFEEEKSPTYYGDIYSFLARAGGRPMRKNVEGLIAIVQNTAS